MLNLTYANSVQEFCASLKFVFILSCDHIAVNIIEKTYLSQFIFCSSVEKRSNALFAAGCFYLARTNSWFVALQSAIVEDGFKSARLKNGFNSYWMQTNVLYAHQYIDDCCFTLKEKPRYLFPHNPGYLDILASRSRGRTNLRVYNLISNGAFVEQECHKEQANQD